MNLSILGCSGPFPAAGGATSGYLVTEGNTRVMLDLGSGTLGALSARMAPEDLTALVFSHWHSDHCSDALPLIYRLQAAGRVLDVYGPEDPASPVRAVLAAEACVRLHTVCPGEVLDWGCIRAEVFSARHPVPSVMYRLSAGGRTLCYTGDTNTTDGLAAFAAGADLLLADGLFPHSLWNETRPHLSARLCAELAAGAAAGRLILTHLNPLIDAQGLLQEARAVFPRTELARRDMDLTL